MLELKNRLKKIQVSKTWPLQVSQIGIQGDQC